MPMRTLASAAEPSSKQWADYIHAEVRAACTHLGWGHQVRRKWSQRWTPVLISHVEDYEWKLIPNAHGQQPDLAATDCDEGTYYVVSMGRNRRGFVLEHSTFHGGALGPDQQLRTFTEIEGIRVPVEGYLRWFLLNLTGRFRLNCFSIT
jgi:hypothetical protein